MKNNREKILRDIEYINGGITVFKSMCNKDHEKFYHILDEWQDILWNIIDMIEEDDENAEDT